MHRDVYRCVFGGGKHHRPHQFQRRMRQAHLSNLQNNRRFQFFGRFYRAHNHFHIADGERADGNPLLLCPVQQFFHCDQCHKFQKTHLSL